MPKMSVRELQEAYDKAFAENRKEFQLKGLKFLTEYAKYLLQYLKGLRMLKSSDVVEFDQGGKPK